MRTNVKVGIAAAFALAVASQAALARIVPEFYTHNQYNDKSVWITIYDLGKTRHLDYGCVAPGSTRTWNSGHYAFGSFYYIRGEVKEGKDCSGRTLCDTTVQANPQSNELFAGSADVVKSSHLDWYIHPNPKIKNCYWDGNF